MPCLVCEGTPGYYPIHDSRGRHLYNIRCPECEGTGETEEEFDARAQLERDRSRYEAALAETRAAIADQSPSGARPGTGLDAEGTKARSAEG